jgi:hypothetical protein
VHVPDKPQEFEEESVIEEIILIEESKRKCQKSLYHANNAKILRVVARTTSQISPAKAEAG